MCRTIRHRTAASDCRKTLPANSSPKFQSAHWSTCNNRHANESGKQENRKMFLVGATTGRAVLHPINQENMNFLVGRDRQALRSVVLRRNQNAIALCL